MVLKPARSADLLKDLFIHVLDRLSVFCTGVFRGVSIINF